MAANIQIKVDTVDAEKADKVLEALENKADALYTTLTKLNDGSHFDKINKAASGAESSFDKVKAANDDFNTSLGKTTTASNTYIDANGRMRDANGKYVAGIAEADTKTRSFSTGMGLLKQAIAVVGIASLGKAALSMSVDFQAAMNDVEEKLGGSADDMKMLTTLAMDMGSTTAFSASQAGDAISKLSAVSLQSSEDMDKASKVAAVLPDVLDLASAAQISLESSAKLTSATLSQFNLDIAESNRVVNLLAAVGDSSSATIEGLEAALKKAGPAANSYGVSLESTAAVVAVLANNSIDAEVAGTAIAGMFSKLMIATGDGADALGELNLESSDFIKISATGKEEFIGYAEAIELLSDNGITATQTSRIFGLEAGKNLVPLVTAGSDAIREMERSFGDASTASQQAETQMKGLPGAVKNMSSAWEGFNLALMGGGGNAVAETVINGITTALRFLSKDGIQFISDIKGGWDDFKSSITAPDSIAFGFLESFNDKIKSVGDFLAPVIPYLGDFAVAFAAVGAAGPAVAIAGSALAIIGSGLAAVVGVVFSPVVLGIAAVAAGAVLIKNNWEPIAAWWGDLWGGIQGDAEGFDQWWSGTTFEEKALAVTTIGVETAKALTEAFFVWWDTSTLKEHSPEFVVDGLDKFRVLAETFFNWWDTSDFAPKAIEFVSDTLTTVVDAAERFGVWWNTTSFTEKTADITSATITGAYNTAMAFVDWWNAPANTDLEVLQAGVELPSLDVLRAGATDLIQGAISIGADIAAGVGQGIASAALELGIDLPSVDGILAKGNALIAEIKVWWDSVSLFDIDIGVPSFADIKSKVTGIGGNVADTVADEVKAASNKAADAVGDMMSGAADKAVSFLPDWMRRGEEISETVAGGIDSAAPAVVNASNDLGDAINAGIPAANEWLVVGRDVGAGLRDGIVDSKAGVVDASVGMADDVITASAAALGVQSPSVIFKAMGRWLGIGLGDGISDGSSLAEAEAVVMAQSVSSAALDELNARKDDFAQGVGDLFRNAGSIDDVLDGIKQKSKAWLTTMIGDFAQNEVKVLMGIGDTSGAEGDAKGFMGRLSSMFTTGFDQIASLFGGSGGFMGKITSAISGGLDSITSMFSSGGSGGGLSGVIGGLKDSIGGLFASGSTATGILGSLGGAISSVAPFAGVAITAFTALKGVFGGYKTAAEGFQFSVSDGDIFGDSVEVLKKKTLLFKSKYKTVLSDMDTETFTMLSDFFTGLDDNVSTFGAQLGIASADSITSSLTFASGEILNDDQLEVALEALTRQAYTQAFTSLGPEMQAIVSDGVDLTLIPIEDFGQRLSDLGTIAQDIVPMLDSMGMTVGDSFDSQVASASGLVTAIGDVDTAQAQLTALYEASTPKYQQLQDTIDGIQVSVDGWNTSIGLLEGSIDGVIQVAQPTVAEFDNIRDRVEQFSGSNAAFTASVMTNVDDMLGRFTTGVDSSTGAVQINVSALSAYNTELQASETATAAQKNAAYLLWRQVELGTTAIEEQTAATFNTIEGATNYIDAQKSLAAAGTISTDVMNTNVAAALAQIDSIVELEAMYTQQAATLKAVADVTSALNLNFDATAPSATNASAALVEMMGGLDSFQTATQKYMTNFYSDAEITQIELANNAAAVQVFTDTLNVQQLATLESEGGMRALVESFNLNTTAGQELFTAAMGVQDAFVAVSASGLETQTIIDELPENLRGNFTTITEDTTQFGAGLVAANDATNTAIIDSVTQTTASINETLATSANDSSITLAGMHTGITATMEQINLDSNLRISEMMTNVGASFDQGSIDSLNTVSAMSQNISAEYSAMATSNEGITADGAQRVADKMLEMANQMDVTTSGMSTDTTDKIRAMAGSMATEINSMSANATGQVVDMSGKLNTEFGAMAIDGKKNANELNTGVVSESLIMMRGTILHNNGMATLIENRHSQMKDNAIADSISMRDGVMAGFRSMTTYAAGVGTQANVAATSLGNLAGTLRNVASSAASSAANAANAANVAAVTNSTSYVADGSHSSGLDRVPFDGYKAIVHKNEMIPNPDISNQLRALGVTATHIPDSLINGGSVTIPSASASSAAPVVRQGNSNAELVAQVKVLTKAVEKAEQSAARAAEQANSNQSRIASATSTQVQQSDEWRQEQKTLSKQQIKAAKVA